MAETFTPNYALSKFDQGDNPPILTAAKLNANWDAIDTQIKNRDTFDRFAATRIVDPSGAGTHTTIPAALASMPAAGGTIFLKGVTYNISAGLVVPANVRIIGAGRNSTILNMTGALTLFTTSGGYFCLSEVTVQGDDTSAQIVFNTDHDVDIACSDFKQIKGVINAVSSAAEVSMRDCYILLSALAGTGIYLWKGATGGQLNWDYVHMSVPITSATLVEGPTGGSAGCNWKVVQSYTGAPPPVTANFYYLQTVDWVNFKVDVAKIVIYGQNSKLVGCDFNTCFVRFDTTTISNAIITGCNFALGGNDFGIWIAQLIFASGASDAVVSGCVFRGNSVSFVGINIQNCQNIVITGCEFRGHTNWGIAISDGAPACKVVVTGCAFSETLFSVLEGSTSISRYNANSGFTRHGLSDHSVVDSENFRNVRTFGATGDGVTDDIGDIQTACNLLPDVGATVFFPPGHYKISDTILLQGKPIKIQGSGDGTIIDCSSGSFAAFTADVHSELTHISISDLQILGGGGGGGFAAVGGPVVGATLNDTFASAPSVTGANGSFAAGSTAGFTGEGGEPLILGNAVAKSGWLEWTAPASGTATIDLSGTGFDTLLAVYTGVSVGALTLVVADDDSGAGLTSLVAFPAVMGTSYKFKVDGFGGASGPVTVTMSLVAALPGGDNNIIHINDALGNVIVSMERVNAYAVSKPIKVSAGLTSRPTVINMTDCYIQQLADSSSILIVNSPLFRPVNLTLDKVRFYRDFEDAVVGTLAEGGFFINYSNVNFIATDCFFAIGTDDCVIGALNARGCTFYNGSPASNKRICVADDNFSAISSSVEGCLFSFVDMDIVGNGTKFSDCTFQTSVVRDDAISYFSDCYFLGVTGSVNTPNNAVIFGSGDTAVVGCYFSASNTFGAIILNPGRVIGCKFSGSAVTGYITLENGDALISGNEFPSGSPAIIETVSGANAIFGNRFRASSQPTLLATSQALANKVSDVSTQGTIFTQTADVTIANTVTETSLLGTGKGVKTIPADWMVVGRTLRLILRGYVSDTGTPNFRVRVKLGATVILDTGAVAFSGTIVNNEWCIAADITCRVAGFSGSVIGQGSFAESPDNRAGMVNTAPVAVNLFTSPLALDVTFEWGTASASNTITCTNATLEAV